MKNNIKYFALCSDNIRTGKIKIAEIKNPEQIPAILEEKKQRPEWYLSVSGVSERLDCNPSAPLYIYGAQTASIIVDETGELIYSAWSGEFKQQIETDFINQFKQKLTN